MFKRISHQILRDVISYAGATLFLVLTLLVIAKLSQYLKQVAYGELPFSAVLTLIWLGLPVLLSTVLPIALFFGVFMAFNRMYRFNEMTALAAAGVSLSQLARPALTATGLVVIFQGFVGFYWAPHAERELVEQANHYARLAGLALIQPGAFNRLPDARVLYLGKPLADQPNRYQGVFVHEGSSDGRPMMTLAAWGQVTSGEDGSLDLLLLDGRRYMGTAGQAGFKVLRFARYRVHIPPPKVIARDSGLSSKGNLELLAMRDQPRAVHAWLELQWRLGWPLLLPMLALLAMALAYVPPRGGRAGGVLIGGLLLLLFNNLLLLDKSWVEHGQWPLFPGLFAVHGLLLVVSVYLFYRRNAGKPLLALPGK